LLSRGRGNADIAGQVGFVADERDCRLIAYRVGECEDVLLARARLSGLLRSETAIEAVALR
jgi:hypothetical protein